MIVRNPYERILFDSDQASLLQMLLTTPIAPSTSRHGLTGARREALEVLGADEMQALLEKLLGISTSAVATPSPHSTDSSALLEMLLQMPAPSAHRYRSIARRRIELLRRMVLQDHLQPESFDTLLSHAQWALTAVAVLALGSWAAFGPIGNWVHDLYKPRMVSEPAKQHAPQSPASARAKPTPISASVANAQPDM